MGADAILATIRQKSQLSDDPVAATSGSSAAARIDADDVYTEDEIAHMRALLHLMDAKTIKAVLNALISHATKRKEDLEATDVDVDRLRAQVHSKGNMLARAS